MLNLIGVGKQYKPAGGGVVKALECVSLSVGRGEFVAVEGPSGSGKTTLLLLAGGLLPPSEGSVQYAGEEIYSMSAGDRAEFRAGKIGFVFQQFHLISYLSVLENVLVPSLTRRNQSGAKSRARELLRQFNLDSRSDHFPSELSTGERQRVSLARALFNKPGLLLADEPTGNLDRENARIVLECLATFAREGGAVLMVTHSLEASAYGGRVIHLKDGRLSGNNGGEESADA
ncbi:ABC transporter ATP-binding protein [Gemmatimonadota bacterium]